MSQGTNLNLKRKNVNVLFDYCLDNRIEFVVKPSPMVADEFEVEVIIEDIKKAILFGMFLKEAKLELSGAGAPARNTVKKAVAKENGIKEEAAAVAPLAFEENTISFDLEAN